MKRSIKTYSLFVKRGNRWRRLSTTAHYIGDARSIYQNALLAGSTAGLRVELRPASNTLSISKSMEILAERRTFHRELQIPVEPVA